MSEEAVRVSLGDDYYLGAYFNTDTSAPRDYEVPKSQLERWEAAKAAYEAMQDEIEQVMREQREQAAARRPRVDSPMSDFLKRAYSARIEAAMRTQTIFRARGDE